MNDSRYTPLSFVSHPPCPCIAPTWEPHDAVCADGRVWHVTPEQSDEVAVLLGTVPATHILTDRWRALVSDSSQPIHVQEAWNASM